MWLFYFLQLFIATSAVGREAYERIGYFWHITDMHYSGHESLRDDFKRGNWRHESEDSKSKSSRGPMGRYDHDANWELIESAAHTMMSRQNDNVEFVLWTGDALSHWARHHLSEERQIDLIQNITDLLSRVFTSHFVFPALGHDDPNMYKRLGVMWYRWLPIDSMKTFETGGYYIIERKMYKLQIVVLNTNLMREKEDNKDATEQWEWLNKVLKKFQRNGETVYLVGHVAPGSNERQKGGHSSEHTTYAYTDYHNKRYLKTIRKYADIIKGQFFGHLHSDTFRVIYEENAVRPVSFAMVAPSVTPRRSFGGPNNPGLRLYKFDRDTGQVFDYTQYYLDLLKANTDTSRNAEWHVEYNFSTYYAVNEINALNLHILADKLTQHYPQENSPFDRYYRANAVHYNRKSTGCDANCAHTHYCAITKVDYQDFQQCLQTDASALSTSRALIRISLSYLILVMNVIVIGMMR